MPANNAMQANTQHAVPQNIMDVEFKLIGELTMRQFFYIMVFAAIAYVAWSFNLPVVLKWPTVIGSILLGLGFAFVPIEDRGMDEWIVNFFGAVYAENQKVWRKEVHPPSAFLHENIAIVKQELITLAPTTSRRKLEQYLLEQHETSVQDPLDMPEQAYIEKVHAAFVSVEPVQTAVALEEPLVETTTAPPLPDMPSGPDTEQEKPEETPTTPEEKKEEEIHPSQEQVSPEEIIKTRPKSQKSTFKIPTTGVRTPLAAITPDRHTGRKFTNLLESSGNIVLPIRGEKILTIPTDEPDTGDTSEKAQQLKAYLDQLKATEGINIPSTPEVTEETKEVEAVAEEALRNIQAENERLMTEIEKLKADMAKEPSKPEEEKKMSLRDLIAQQTKKEETLKELEQKVKTLHPEDNLPGRDANEITTETLPAPKVPNVITGVVKDIQNKGIAGVLLIIKNSHNDPVRAIKTNALGQFAISNPLPNGMYKVNIDVNKETSHSFDIIDVEAKGEIIPPLEFVGK